MDSYLYTAKEAAEAVGKAHSTVRNALCAGSLKVKGTIYDSKGRRVGFTEAGLQEIKDHFKPKNKGAKS